MEGSLLAMPYYNNIPVSFRYHSSDVTGILSGSLYNWQFVSNSEIFVRHFPDGKFSRHITLSSINDCRYEFIEALLGELDSVYVEYFGI